MELAPLIPAYRADEGELQINTDLAEASALGLEKMFNLFFGYYHYPRVLLRINSNGGQLVALHHILQVVERWRQEGREIRTEATFRAASAAALLLSLGEVASRRVQRHTALLYHTIRIGGSDRQITAGSADHLASLLQSRDQMLLRQLAAHVAAGFGGPLALAVEGRARCELLLLNRASLAEALDGHVPRSAPKWLRVSCAMHRECQERHSTAPYLKALTRRFEQDMAMDLREAYALGLIDSIVGVPELVPRATTLAPVTVENRSLKLAA